MSEHWKSTPKYWCKHCSTYVRDTKLERANHESTAKHQSAIKRSLRDLHRGHEREEREKDRARREVERLNGVVSGNGSAASSSTNYPRQPQPVPVPSSKPAQATEAQLKRQREQLAELGVAVPSTFRPEMAMAGEWTVTNTRVITDEPLEAEKVEARAIGVRKRDIPEEAREEEDAVKGLFKKQKKWGRDSRSAPQDEDAELDALLSGSVIPKKQPLAELDLVKKETGGELAPIQSIKQEQDDVPALERMAPVEEVVTSAATKSKEDVAATSETTPAAAVIFKKRKPKGLRQK